MESYTMSNSKFTDPFQQSFMQQDTHTIQEFDQDFREAQLNNDFTVQQQDDSSKTDTEMMSSSIVGGSGNQRNSNLEKQMIQRVINLEVENKLQQYQIEDQAELSLFQHAINNEQQPITAEELRDHNKRLLDEKSEHNRMSDLKDAQKLLMMDGRFKVKDPQLGTGKQDLFNSFRN